MKRRLLLIIGIIFLANFSAQAPLEAYYQTGPAELNYSYQAPVVPVPPQSVIVNTQNIHSGRNNQDIDTEVIHYMSAGSAKENIRFYKRTLQDAGWRLLSEINKGALASLSLSRDDNKTTANITVRSNSDGGSDIYVSVSQALEESAPAYAIGPASNTSDKEPTWAPSYPGSIRRMYSEDKQSGRATAVYATEAPVEAIVKFYSEMMPNSGWWLRDKVTLERIPGFGSGNYQNLVFESWQGNCVVSVNRAQDLSKYGQQNENLTAILLSFEPKR